MSVIPVIQTKDNREESMSRQPFASSVQRKGQVTIPQPLREAFNIQPGDEVYFKRSEEGILLTTEKLEKLARFNETLNEISALLAEKEAEAGVRPSLEALIEEVRAKRGTLLKEKYGLDPRDE